MPPSKAILAAVLVLILIGSTIAVVMQSCSRRSPPVNTSDWYYDLNTGQLFAGPRRSVPPIDAPSGPLPDGTPAGVRAHVFGCGGCLPKQQTIAWLETYTVAQRDLLRPRPTPPGELPKPFMPKVQIAPMIKRPGDAAWVNQATDDGRELLASVLPKCPGDMAPQECWP